MERRIISEYYYDILNNMFMYLIESFEHEDTLDIETTEDFVEEMYKIFKRIPLI